MFLPQKDEANKYTGATLPQIMGHELSGTIIEVGQNVIDYAIGERVIVNPCMGDKQRGQSLCESCLSGRPNICVRTTFYGINDNGGGFAEEIVVQPTNLLRLPANVSLKLAALAEPLAVAAHMVRMSGFQTGQNALIFGAGPIGCALTFLLREGGAKQVIVSEVEPSRASQAQSSGANRVINPLEENVPDVVEETMSTGADVSFEACGLQVTLDTAIACTKPGGTIFNVAIHEKPITINMNLLTLPEKRLLAGNAYTAEDFGRVIQLLSTRSSELERFITASVPLENAVEGAFEEIINNKSKHNKILVRIGGDEG